MQNRFSQDFFWVGEGEKFGSQVHASVMKQASLCACISDRGMAGNMVVVTVICSKLCHMFTFFE
jgi:hypothetical protein